MNIRKWACLALLLALLCQLCLPGSAAVAEAGALPEAIDPIDALPEGADGEALEAAPVDAPPEELDAFEIGADDAPSAPAEPTPEPASGDSDAPGLTVEAPIAVEAETEAEAPPAESTEPTDAGEDGAEIPDGAVDLIEAVANAAEEAQPPIPATGLTVPAASLVLGVGESVSMGAAPVPEGAACALKYSTSKKKYATVSAGGIITAKKVGSAWITARDDLGHSVKVKVTVRKKPGKVTLKIGRKALGVGEAVGYTYSLPKKTAGRCEVSVDAGGALALDAERREIIAVSPGVGVVTVRTYNGKKATAKITVSPAPEYLIPSAGSLETGVGLTAGFSAAPPAGTMSAVRYESLNPDIAAIDAKTGRIKALAAGDAIVRGVAHNGAVGECAVRVLPMPEAIEVSAPSVRLLVGEVYVPDARMVPENAYGQLTLSTKNKKVAKISGNAVRAVAKGSTTVILKAANGVSRAISVQVAPAPKAIVLNTHTANLASGQALSMGYRLTGGGETLVSFASSSPGVASVDAVTGEVTGLSAGTAIITARTLNGLSDCCLVNVDLDVDDGSAYGDFEITFMNIGRNDGILIRCDGEYAFIDSGMHQQGVTAVKYLRQRGITHLKYYIGTHAHRDHVGGAAPILSAFKVDLVVVPHGGVTSLIKKEAKGAAEKAAVNAAKYYVLKAGGAICLGGARIKCLGPIKIKKASYKSTKENNNSLILNVRHGSNSFLLTGDEIAQVQKARPGSMRAQVLKNPHHNGRRDSIVKYCDPEITVFSTSKSALPTNSFVKWIKKRGCAVYITASNRNGHVTIYSDGSKLTVATQK